MTTKDNANLPAPHALAVSRIVFDEDEYVVLSYPVADYQAPAGLTSAESEVALAFAGGASLRAIARGRGASIHTVANQLRSTYAKLAVRSRLQLARRMLRP